MSKHTLSLGIDRSILYILLLLLPTAFTSLTADPTDVKVLLVNLAVILIVCEAAFRVLIKGIVGIGCMTLDMAVFLFVGWNVVMALVAEYRWASITEIVRLLGYAVIYFGVRSQDFALSSAEHKAVSSHRTPKVLMLASVVPCVYGAVQHFGLDPIQWAYPSYERVLATFGNPTYFAAYLVLMIPVTLLAFLKEDRRILRWAYLLLMALQFACLLWTWSRGPWLGLLLALGIGLGIPAILGGRILIRRHGIGVGIGLGALILVTILVSLDGMIVERAASSVDVDDPSNVQRALQWNAGLAVFREHPIIGVGPGNLRIHMPEKLTPAFFRTGVATASEHAHNEFIEIAADTGIIGLILFLSILVTALVMAIRMRKDKDPDRPFAAWIIVGALAGFLVCNTVGVAMRYSTGAVYFWLFLGMLSALAGDGAPVSSPAREPVRTPALPRGRHPRRAVVAGPIILLAVIGVLFAVRPIISSVWQRQGDILFAQQRMEEAEAPYLESLKFSPNNVSSLYNLGIVYTATDRLEQALAIYDRVGRLWPDIGRIHFNLGTIYASMGELPKARTELEQAASIDGLPDTWAYLSRVYTSLGEPEKAEEAALKAEEAALEMPSM